VSPSGTRPAPRRPVPTRATVLWRRVAVVGAALVVAGVVAVVGARVVSRGDKDRPTTIPAASSAVVTDGGSQGTTAGSATRGSSPLEVGEATVTWTDPVGSAPDYLTGGTMPRTLLTEIRYPTRHGSPRGATFGAPPARSGAPWPVIVFAHGYDTTPGTYAALLDAWVRAGFVVVAPLFPVENAHEIAALGGPQAAYAKGAEGDVFDEPTDVAYVVDQVAAADEGAASAGAPVLDHLVDLRELALAGQSDGGDAVAALVYDAPYASDYARMAVHPRAVAVLSGSEFEVAASNYAAPPHPPALLVVQSAADACNLPEDSVTLYDDIDSPKWFLELFHAHHLPAYTGGDPGATSLVTRVTIAFFEDALGLVPGGRARAALLEAGSSAPSVGELSFGPDAPEIPNPPEDPNACFYKT